MKRKEFTEFKAKTVKDLQKFVSDKKTEMNKKKVEIFSGKEKNLKYFNNLRRDVAKVLTIINEKRIIERLEDKKSQ